MLNCGGVLIRMGVNSGLVQAGVLKQEHCLKQRGSGRYTAFVQDADAVAVAANLVPLSCARHAQ